MYAKTDLERIREKVDIIKFLEDRGTTFRQSGTSFQALCPIHSERSPSFSVRPSTNTFRCFGCGRSGDIFTLVQEMDGLSFTGAVQELAAYGNITLESVEEDPDYQHKRQLYKIVQVAADWFRQQFLDLPDEHPAHRNLAARQLLYPNNEAGYGGITDPIIGYAPARGLLDVLMKENYSLDEIIEAGLATRNNEGQVRERFRNRLLWTVQDASGRPVGFSGRKVLPEDEAVKEVPKYLNSPETPLYKKSSALLGLAWAKKVIAQTQHVYVVEGQTDVMALRAVGFDNVVASCGTAFTSDHAQILTRLSAAGRDAERFQIIFCFDGDAAGVNAAKKVFANNPNIQLYAQVAPLEQYDPCDMRINKGDKALQDVLNNTIPLTEFILLEELKGQDVKTPEGKIAYLNQAKETLGQITNSIQRDSYLRKLALWTGLPIDEIRPMLASGGTVQQEQQRNSDTATLEQKILAFGLQYPQVFVEVAEKARLNATMFPQDQALAQQILEQAETNYADEATVHLLHLDLQVEEKRAAEVLRGMLVAYYKLLTNREINQSNMRLTDPSAADEDPEELFMSVLMEQEHIKQKYALDF